jgi:hypothetical protein
MKGASDVGKKPDGDDIPAIEKSWLRFEKRGWRNVQSKFTAAREFSK